MYKLLSTDIDGTLLAENGSLPPATKQTLSDLYNAGMRIVFSSGRADISMRSIVQEILGLNDSIYLVSYNGGRISTALSDTLVFEKRLEQNLIAEIMSHIRPYNVHVQGYSDSQFVVEDSEYSKKIVHHYSNSTGMSWQSVANMESALPQGSIKLLIIGKNEILRECAHSLNTISRGRFACAFSRPSYLEIIGEDVNKGSALAHIAKYLGIALKDCIACGDNENDREMLQYAGLGVAVGNAVESVKLVADAVLTRTSDESALTELVSLYLPHIYAQKN